MHISGLDTFELMSGVSWKGTFVRRINPPIQMYFDTWKTQVVILPQLCA
jgi:hypothetical protein